MQQHLPQAIKTIVDRATVIPISIGHSQDTVYRLEAEATYYLKIGASLTDEAERLEWLEHRLPTPKLLHFEVANGQHYMLTSAVKGQMLMQVDLPIARCLELLAEGARMWHNLATHSCPFQWQIAQQIDSARAQLAHQRIDATEFDSQYYGKTVPELFTDLLNAIPDGAEDLVVTHGDFCLPNILVDRASEQITGFVDLGHVNVSDRHLDLVLASRSIAYNFGSKYIPYFYEHYGAEIDPAKRHFYSILNEFA